VHPKIDKNIEIIYYFNSISKPPRKTSGGLSYSKDTVKEWLGPTGWSFDRKSQTSHPQNWAGSIWLLQPLLIKATISHPLWPILIAGLLSEESLICGQKGKDQRKEHVFWCHATF
jgi:hypothetical protein